MRKHPAALTAAAAALLVFFAVTFAYPLSRMLAQITPEAPPFFPAPFFAAPWAARVSAAL